jgi:hypothetical protein
VLRNEWKKQVEAQTKPAQSTFTCIAVERPEADSCVSIQGGQRHEEVRRSRKSSSLASVSTRFSKA